jgi:hypothetical protein
MYVLPGFVDAHAHVGNVLQGLTGPLMPPEYIFKLWMGHGVTTAREVGAGMGLGWTLAHKERSAANEITAPRLVVHARFPGGQGAGAIATAPLPTAPLMPSAHAERLMPRVMSPNPAGW